MDEAKDPADMNWDPTSAMTSEERMGYEMIRALEGQLVTDDTFRAHTRELSRNVKTLQRQLIWTRFIAMCVALVLVGLAAWSQSSAAAARDAARDVDQTAYCNEARLDAVANRVIYSELEKQGCDMTIARTLIGRGEFNDEVEDRLTKLETEHMALLNSLARSKDVPAN